MYIQVIQHRKIDKMKGGTWFCPLGIALIGGRFLIAVMSCEWQIAGGERLLLNPHTGANIIRKEILLQGGGDINEGI